MQESSRKEGLVTHGSRRTFVQSGRGKKNMGVRRRKWNATGPHAHVVLLQQARRTET